MAKSIAVCYLDKNSIMPGTKMKKAFPEHFVGEPERQQKLWSDCVFVLDTNVLLDLYRFSDSARGALFKVMESLGERLWIPYQVAAEYFENRLNVIEEQSEAYAKSIAGLKIAKDKFNSGSRHPFVSDVVFNQFISSYDLMIKELEDKQKTYLSFVGDDVIKVKIGSILDGKVGEPYSDERLQEIAAEGEKRYLENIPPGFQDGGKMPEATTNKLRLKKFGDLILWRQVIEKAVDLKKPVILVTGEKKDDWWLKSNKRLVSALPALTKEFVDSVSQDFYLYATDRFLLKANDYLKQNTSENVVEEVRSINKADAERRDDDVAIFDQALNTIWSHGNPGVFGSVIDKWRNKSAKFEWSQIEPDLVRNSQAHVLVEQRSMLLQRAQGLRAQIEEHVRERDELKSIQHAFLGAGISANDDKFISVSERLAVLNALIAVYEKEFVELRSQMSDLIARQVGMLNGDGEN